MKVFFGMVENGCASSRVIVNTLLTQRWIFTGCKLIYGTTVDNFHSDLKMNVFNFKNGWRNWVSPNL